ncbi:MAG: tRNA pseudouridine(54/55) synthase Pus10 [Candidatus Heimdallarchaeota archaeon]|nr:tRNA pseudouridine(54/55) synthase Pus10 [Candidatus Heimdallarchaeota archaeon]
MDDYPYLFVRGLFLMESYVLKQVLSLLEKYHICNSCLGRQFGNLLSGLTNESRGMALKTVLLMEWENKSRLTSFEEPVLSSLLSKDYEIGLKSVQRYFPESTLNEAKCDICNDYLLPVKLEKLAIRAVDTAEELDFGTFLVGCIFPPSMLDKEDSIRSTFNLEYGESIKSEFNREVGKRIQARLPEILVDFKAPDVVFTFEVVEDRIEVKKNPLMILGRYKKLTRGIPQSKWHCRVCRGTGCERCNFTGKMYQESVEEFVSEPVLSAAEGASSKFHGSGREDIDALMLGTGRPFVLEISEPRKRSLDFQELASIINKNAEGKVEVEFEGITDRSKVRELKTRSSRNSKGYRATIEFDQPVDINNERIQVLESELTGKIINQRTPIRVAHRRADKIRSRKVQKFEVEKKEPKEWVVYIICEGGLYVKELISGDEGRTHPSLSELLQVNARVIALDVMEVFKSHNDLEYLDTNPSI